MNLDGASILLTGGSRGIGAALARALAPRRARLTLVARDARALDGVAREVTARGGTAQCVPGDVQDPRTAVRAVAAAAAAYGGVDLLVNNAAILADPAPLVDARLDTFRDVLLVNVLGTAAFLKAALPSLSERRGAAVNLSSGWGRTADAGVSSYVASKWAVEGLTRSVALEVPDGVCVVAVNPGIVNTEMLSRAWGAGAASYPPPEELAPKLVRLLEQLGPSWNGRSLDADDF